jgi:hypothetical protein
MKNKKSVLKILSANSECFRVSAGIAPNVEHIRRQGFEIQKLVYFRKFNQRTKAESLHFCPAFVYVLLAVVRFIKHKLNFKICNQKSF